MKRKIRKFIRRFGRRGKNESAREAPSRLTPITDSTLPEHREEVLSSARKYVYPLSHSKRRVVMTSIWLVVAAVLAFLIYCGVALYKVQSTSNFIYEVSRVVPFPVAKAGPHYVSYESYLFELRHYIHYYQTQQQVDFNSASGKLQLKHFKQQALQQVIDNSFVQQLASQNHVTVSDQEVSDAVNLVRSQNRLGDSTQVFQNVLQNFWGWTVKDFQRELKEQLLAQKVVTTLDTGTQQRAQQAMDKLNHGANFTKLAAKVSEDPADKASGGKYPTPISPSDRDMAPQVTQVLFKLRPGQHSGIINTGYSLEIVKVLSKKGDKVSAAHMSFNFQSIDTYLGSLKARETTQRYIDVKG